MHKLSRRQFCHLTAAALGGVAAGACSGELTGPSGPDGTSEPPLPPWDPPGPNDPIVPVSAARGADLSDITRLALDRLGGIGEVVHQDETVFIKPNMVTLPWGSTRDCFANGECTKPEIVVAVAEQCLEAGAAEVVIGDGSQMPSFDWTYATTLDGSTNLVQEAARLATRFAKPVSVVSLEADSPSWSRVASRTYLGTIAVSSLVTGADRVISIPVAKTHSWAQLTLALKNFVGVTSLDEYGVWTGSSWDRGGEFDHSSPRAIAQIYLDVVAGVRPDLAVIDFSIGVEASGPTMGSGGRTVDMRDRLGSWLVLASTDLVAADATTARIMRHNVESQTQLVMAYGMGLGEPREGAIELVGEELEALRVAWQPAVLQNNPSGAPAYSISR
jgi:uncharacterized protein (DUF362 family)